MAKTYETKAFTVNDVTVTVSKAKSSSAADRLEAFLKWLGEHLVDPGYGRPESPPNRPDQGLPGKPPGSAEQPGIDNTLPTPPVTPDNTLPGSQPGIDNTLPGAQPGIDNTLPGQVLIDHAKEIAAAILKDTACDPAQPKK